MALTNQDRARHAVIDADNSAADAAGNGEEARYLASIGVFDKCLERLEWLKQNADTAKYHAERAIEEIKKLQEVS